MHLPASAGRRPIRARIAALGPALALTLSAAAYGAAPVAAAAGVLVRPAVADATLITTGATPPSEADCLAAGRRCFTPAGFHAAYDLGPLYAAGLDGRGITVAIVDSYGSDTMAHDLHVFDQAFGLPPMCGEEGVTCEPGMPWFKRISLQGTPATVAQPGGGPHLEDKSAWSLEVALDVESVHTFAPGANILLVTVPTAETLGVQGLPLMMNAEQYVVDHHLADVISQSFGASEATFPSSRALLNLRHAYEAAADAGVTVLASTGDFGTTNLVRTPVSRIGSQVFPFVNVSWPASDPLVTAVGGTYLCTDPGAATRVVDSSSPPSRCAANPGQAEVGWIDAGGGFSQIFARPSYQDTLPPGSTAIGSMRAIPDIASEASSLSGPLIYDSNAGLDAATNVAGNDGGWFVIGGTSVSCPQWAGMVAIADQINGGGLGLINPALYALAANPTAYAADFFDVTTGDNGAFAPDVPGYPATTGWDPVTGLGTPDAARLLPDLVAQVNGP